jgi:hypothetical protein
MNVHEQLLVQTQAQGATFSCCAPMTPQGPAFPPSRGATGA